MKITPIREINKKPRIDPDQKPLSQRDKTKKQTFQEVLEKQLENMKKKSSVNKLV